MHILYFHQYFISREGSGGTRSYENAIALVKAGHKVTVICGHSKSGLKSDYKNGLRVGIVDGINIIQINTKYSNHQSFPRRAASFMAFILRSSRYVFSLDYDIIVTTSTPLTVGIPGILAKILRKKYFIFEVRDLWPELPKAMGIIKNPLILALMSLLEYCSYKSANKLIGLSSGMVDGIVRRGIKRSSIKLIPNGCDNLLFQSEVSNPYIKINEISDNDFIAIFSGAHGIANGLDAVLDTAKYLKSINEHNIKFIFIGDGSSKKDLIQRANSEELMNCIFLQPMPKTDIVSYIKNADVGLQVLKNIPEFYNGTSPNKFYDYISAGIPVITNYPGEVAKLIERNNIGIAVEPDNIRAFAEAILYLKNMKEDIAVMKNNSLKLAKDEFDRDKIVEAWVNWVTEDENG
tara:strand:+ start:15695 stop:16912 length:1218 start_codon:yes stop_codon:yes gene_type:complete